MREKELAAHGNLMLKSVFIVSVCLLHYAAFYILSINLYNASLALMYGVFCIIIPGFLIQAVLIKSERIGIGIRVSAALILGFGAIVLSYFLYLLSHEYFLFYLFISAYMLLLKAKVRRYSIGALNDICSAYASIRFSSLILYSIVFSCLLFYGVLTYPTPGIGPIMQDHHSLSHTSQIVSLQRSFPLASVSMSDVHQVSGYNTITGIVGANFCMLTRIPAHLFYITYNYLIFIPFFFIAILLIFNSMNIKGKYAVYGSVLLAFGGDFLYGQMYVLQTYSPQLLGLILLFCLVSVTIKTSEMDALPAIILSAIGSFLLVGTRLHAALAFVGGLIVYSLLQYKVNGKPIERRFLFIFSASSLLGFFVFFKYGVTESFNPITSQPYFLFSFLEREFIPNQLFSYLNTIGTKPLLIAVLMSVVSFLYWPIGMFLHLSYMLPAFASLREEISASRLGMEEWILMGIISFVYISVIFIMTSGGGQYYYMDFGFKSLLLLFLLQIKKHGLFESIRNYARISAIDFIKPFKPDSSRQDAIKAIALIWAIILVIPFYSVSTAFAHMIRNFSNDQTIRNIYASSIFSHLQKNRYSRDSYNYLDKDIYAVFSFIRENTSLDKVIVAPYFVLPLQDPNRHYGYDFFISALTERTAYLENSYSKVPKIGEALRREKILWKLHNDAVVDKSLRSKKYVFVLQGEVVDRLKIRYAINVLYQSESWFVVEIG